MEATKAYTEKMKNVLGSASNIDFDSTVDTDGVLRFKLNCEGIMSINMFNYIMEGKND